MMLALGALVSVAASPVAAQMVIGGARPSVDVNWDVLDKLGPEPTLPGLVTRKPPPVKPVAPADRGVVFKPYGGGQSEAKAEVAPKTVKAKVTKAAAPVTVPAPVKEAKPVVEEPKIAEIPGVPPAEKVSVAPQPPKPAKAEVATEVPPPPKVAKPVVDSKVKAPAEVPAKVEVAPSAVQFAKAPEPPPAVVVPPPLPPAPAPMVIAPPPAPVAPAPVVQAPVVQAPVAPAMPVVQPAAPPPQLAAVAPPAAGLIRKGDNLTVLFAVESEHLPDTARGDLEKMAQKMERDEGLTLQLLAYAAGDEANASKARRLSLTRALKVRTYLMELGVRSTRIEVRALGNKVEGGPADRVDLVLGSR